MPATAEETRLVAERIGDPALTWEDLARLRTRVQGLREEERAAREALARFDEVASSLPAAAAAARRALLEHALGHTAEATAALAPRAGEAECALALGLIALDGGEAGEAAERLETAAAKLRDVPLAAVLAAEALRRAGRAEEALARAEAACKAFSDSPDAHVARGRVLEDLGRTEEALDAYEAALALDASHPEANFRSAYILDLRGEDEEALERYRRVSEGEAPYLNAALNLALLYEDRGDHDKAIRYCRTILATDPQNDRAGLFLKDSLGSVDMFYDEAREKDEERLQQLLTTPISEFELSVRSRNCLARMNIHALGDLVRRREGELLSHKNFGETSLREIKELLKARSLQLGMMRESDERRARQARARIAAGEDAILSKPILELGLSVRSRNCMAQLGILSVGDLVRQSENDLLKVKNFGRTSLQELRDRLKDLGLSLRAEEES